MNLIRRIGIKDMTFLTDLFLIEISNCRDNQRIPLSIMNIQSRTRIDHI